MLDIYPRAAFDIYNKIKMTFPHDVDELCEEIHKACKGLGTDEKKLIEILGPRSARQRTLVGIRYKELYNQSLLELIRSETSGDLGFLLRLIVMPLPEAEAYILNKACKGLGTTENLIYPIIVGRPTEELDVLKKAYFAKYDEDLGVMLNGELSGDFHQIIMTSLQAPVVPYNPSFHTKAKAEEDAEALYKAGEGKWGTDEKTFLKIILAAPAKYIQMLDAAYTEKYGHGLLKAIAAEFSGTSKNALDYLVRLVLDPYDLIAEKIEGAMKGFGTDEQKLSAYLVRYHKYQAKIEQAYEEKYKTTLRERVRRYNYLRLYNGVLMFLAPIIVNAVCFSVYVLMGNTLDVPTAFVVLALTNACRMPFSIFANASVYVSEASASASRIGAFLMADEVEDHTLMLTSAPVTESIPVLSLQDADFQWVHDAPEPTLRGISLTIVPGSLTVIVGAVGSGKSSLMNAFLGEMLQTRGSRQVRGTMAYASQQPWIQNQTLRENILFGEPFDATHYQQVVAACQLLPDFAMLEQGDTTEIGERGINLSGGQKARVSIARAMYRSRHSDVLLLDDPLSALDVHVANAVFADGLNGIAQGKTRLLVLNAHYHFLHQADRILVMQDGRIVGDGTLAELKEEFPFLGSSPRAHNKGEASDSEDEEEDGGDQTSSKKAAADATDLLDAKHKHKHDKEGGKAKKLIVEEDRNVGSVNLKTYVKYLACCGWDGYMVAATIVVLFAVAQLALFFCDWFLSRWSNGSYRDRLDQHQSMGIYVGLIVFTSLFAFARCLFYTEMCMRCSANLHAKFMQRAILAPVTTFFDVTPVGRILNRFSRDLDQVDNPLPYFSMWMLMYFFQIGAAFLVCAGTNPYVLIVYLPLAFVFIAVTKFFQSSARELKRLDGITRSPFLNLVSETIHGIETIRSYEMTERFRQRCEDLLNHNGKFFFAFQASSRWFAMRTDWLVASIIGVVGVLAVATKSSLGASVAGLALTYAAQLTSSFQRMTNLITMTENIMTCFERIAFYDTLDEEGHLMKHREIEPASINPKWPTTGAVTFENVTMRYRPELELVLQGVSFSVQSGEKVGVCGRTGSGKSSLMSVFVRVVEIASGQVTIDGVDISTLPIPVLRSKLTIIPQDPMLFSGSLRLNLDPFDEKNDAELWEVLKKVHLYDVVQRWGSGLEYKIAEKGDNLSVGQRQLLCIARALIRESKVIVMDEATANVDQESDKLIQLTVRESFGGSDKTVLCIAHRLETIIHSDKILVLDSGRVAEFDSPAVLMERPGSIFRSLVESSRAVQSDT